MNKDLIVKSIIGLLFGIGQLVAVAAAGFAWNSNVKIALLENNQSVQSQTINELKTKAAVAESNKAAIDVIKNDIQHIREKTDDFDEDFDELKKLIGELQ